MSQPAKVYVVIYTVYHHVHKLAVEVQKGLESTGVSAKMFQGKSCFLYGHASWFIVSSLQIIQPFSTRNIAWKRLEGHQGTPKAWFAHHQARAIDRSWWYHLWFPYQVMYRVVDCLQEWLINACFIYLFRFGSMPSQVKGYVYMSTNTMVNTPN